MAKVRRSTSNHEPSVDIIERLSTLALIRTAYSSERALMAWMSSSVSLYTFGFSVSKFIDYLEQQDGGVQSFVGFHRVGLALISMGTVALVLAIFEHSRRIQKMRRLGLSSGFRSFLPLGAAAALVLTGIATLIGAWSA
jgi:putative membrane protein